MTTSSENITILRGVAKSAQAMIDEFDTSPKYRSPGGIEARATGKNMYVFRGQSNSDWPLIPSSLRLTHEESDRLKGMSDLEVRSYMKEHLMEELIAIKDFLLLASSIGFQTPVGPEELFEYMLPIEVSAIKGEVSSLPSLPPQVLDAMALAQHHGVKTRLLDWTESPYIAAFFAAYPLSSASIEQPKNRPEYFSILALNQFRLGSYPRLRAFIPQRHEKHFLRAQQGTFILFRDVADRFIETRKWSSIENIIEETKDHITYVNVPPVLISYNIPSSEADEMLRILYDRGISKASLMPNLDNIASNRSYVKALFGD